jgi:hypothetical protein
MRLSTFSSSAPEPPAPMWIREIADAIANPALPEKVPTHA